MKHKSLLWPTFNVILFITCCSSCFTIKPAIADSSISPDLHVLVTPLPLVPGFSSAQIAIANRSEHPLHATLSLYGSSGEELRSLSLDMTASELKTADFADLLSGAPLDSVKSVSVTYYGVFRTLASQVTLSGFNAGGSVDATLYENQEFYSPDLNAVWGIPAHGRTYIAITNTSDAIQQAVFSQNRDPQETFSVDPHATVLKYIAGGDGKMSAVSAHLSSSAAPGVFRATGFVASPTSEYVNTMRFLDPGASFSNSLFATGLMLNHADYALLVKNLTNSTLTLSGRAFLMSDSGHSALKPRRLSPTIIQAGEITSLRLEESVGQDLPRVVALQLRSSEGHSSFSASMSIRYPDTPLLSASVPFRDVTTEESSTGGYPWRLDGDFETHVFLTNSTVTTKATLIRLALPGGSSYIPGRRLIRPGETIMFDIRRLRDEQIPDALGNRLPLNALAGQFVWGLIPTRDDEGGLLGRTVMYSEQERTMRSYSCFSCSCGYGMSSIGLSAGQFLLPNVGSTANVTTYGNYSSPCAATVVPPRTTVKPTWSVTDPAIVSITSANPSVLTGKANGSSKFTASYPGETVTINQGSCSSATQTNTATADGIVGTLPKSATLTSNTLHTYANQTEMSCDGTSSIPNAYGYQRCLNYQIKDTNGNNLAQAIEVSETVADVYTNFGSNNHFGNSQSNANGVFTDQLGLLAHGALPATACAYATQTFRAKSQQIRANCLHYTSVDVSITDVSANPSLCVNTCKP